MSTTNIPWLCGDKYGLGRYLHKLAELVVYIFLLRMACFQEEQRFFALGSQTHRPLKLYLLVQLVSGSMALESEYLSRVLLIRNRLDY